jgi:hypothetical protein
LNKNPSQKKTKAVGLTGWTVSDANLAPQKHWLSSLQRNLN